MQVRIKFDADLVISGCDMKEVRQKFESMQFFSEEAKDCGVEYGETILIEDAYSNDDLSDEYYNS